MSARVQALFERKISRVTRSYEGGTDIRQIAAQVGVSAPTISRWLTIEGYKHKKRGRYPVAMKARSRALSRQGWDNGRIAGLLEVPIARVIEWGHLKENPILGGQKDPLGMRGVKVKKKGKKTQSKVRQHDPNYVYEKGRWRKRKKKKKAWPPPKHRCRKRWTDDEKRYVLQLLDRGFSILVIYRRMRASRKRQLKIWREAKRKGFPPAFPETKSPLTKRRKKAKAGLPPGAAADLKTLEDEALELERKRIELVEKIESEEKAIADAKKRSRALSASVRKEEDRAAALEAWAAGRKPVLKTKKMKALEKAKRAEAKKKPRKKITDSADNKKYFVVSNDWMQLEKATPDELRVIAAIMTDNGFPSRVESTGEEPRAYLDKIWGTRTMGRWDSAFKMALSYLKKYKAKKNRISKTKKYDKRTAQFVAAAYDASKRRTKATVAKRQKTWDELGIVGQFVARFALRLANAEGEPSVQCLARGSAAKKMLKSSTPKKDAKRVRKKVEKKRTERKKVEKKAEEEAKVKDVSDDFDLDALIAEKRSLLGEDDE